MFSLGEANGNGAGSARFRVPGGDSGAELDGGMVGSVPVRVAQDYMASGESAHMKPKVAGVRNAKAEQVVIRIGFPGQRLKAAWKIVFPKIRLDFFCSHTDDDLP